MNLDEYQKEARKTAIYPSYAKIIYPTLGLAGESGETCEKIKKLIRDGGLNPFDKYGNHISSEKKAEIKKELGDVMWYIANLASDLEMTMEEIAVYNLKKLRSRQERGKLQGSGDNR